LLAKHITVVLLRGLRKVMCSSDGRELVTFGSTALVR